MGERYRRPDWVRRVNAMGAAAGGPRRLVPIEAGELIEHTRASTGIADPGDLGDGDWEARLRRLVDGVNGSDLHVVGRLMTREELLRCLRTRFLVGERRRRHPSIADEVITAPVIVTGPARSGTTILFELLGLDPGLRTPTAGSLPGTYVDVRFADLMDDPVAAIAEAYGALGRELTHEHREAITRYLAVKPRGQHGTHHYTAEDWGFDAAKLRTDLADYITRFAVPTESG